MNVLKEINDLHIDWKDIVALRINYYNESIIYTNDGTMKIEELMVALSQRDYDEGYGLQHLFGLILMKDLSWYERCE